MKELIRRFLNRRGYDIVKLPPRHYQSAEVAKKISPTYSVLYGPFAGMLFDAFEANYSSLVPRVVGCYEDELHPLVEQICQTKYTEIIDVGCADGYYAVGFARRMPQSRVFGYDIDPTALQLCQRVATLNNVKNLILDKACTPDTLKQFAFSGRSLIVCDCEGYELDLFVPEVIKNLKNCDVLIELHDLYFPGLSEVLLPRFATTHDLEIIPMRPRDESKYPIVASLDARERVMALTHGVTVLMNWAYLKAKPTNMQ
jgi:SAM-dependent methyltransferase